MPDLSILVPARNEMFLARTIEDILSNVQGDTEIIVVLDGAWAEPPLPDHERVNIVYHPESVGQRAATNEAARLSSAKYVMKLDAHCSVGPGFDVIMMADMQDDWCMVPIMRNLWVFDWVCSDGHRRYQGHGGPCKECGKPTEREMVWIAKTNPQSTSYCFDSEPHFQYFREFKKRPEGKGDITETMSLQGSCFMMAREKYHELNVCDEAFGSWGSQGIEVACKVWLSGGRVVVNHRTYYAHAFRTKGRDWGFPYPLSGKQTSYAKRYARELFFENKWPQQVKPLSWLVKKFWPVRGWTEEDLARVTEAGTVFLATKSLAGTTDPFNAPILTIEKASLAQGVPPLTEHPPTSRHILQVAGKSEVLRVATSPVLTEVLDLQAGIGDGGNHQGVGKTVGADTSPMCPAQPYARIKEEPTVSGFSQGSHPVPATSIDVKFDVGEEPADSSAVNIIERQRFSHGTTVQQNAGKVKLSKAIVYYTDNRLAPAIMEAAQSQLVRASLPIVSVSLAPLNGFGENITLDAERGYLTMFKQILAGLEASTADVIFFCEHDIIYHPSHFDFVPERRDLFYYNQNSWRVDAKTGQALFHYSSSTSGLCAYRELLLGHYRKRVAMVEADGFSRRMGFEPGTHGRAERVDDYKSDTWMSEHPNLDIRHGHNLTQSRWDRSQFRNQKFTKGWTLADEVPGWGRTKGRMKELFDGLSS